MVSARQNGTVLFVGLKGLRESSYLLPVQSTSMTSTIKVSLALDAVCSWNPEAVFHCEVKDHQILDAIVYLTIISYIGVDLKPLLQFLINEKAVNE